MIAILVQTYDEVIKKYQMVNTCAHADLLHLTNAHFESISILNCYNSSISLKQILVLLKVY